MVKIIHIIVLSLCGIIMFSCNKPTERILVGTVRNLNSTKEP